MARLWYSHFDSTEEDERLLLAEDWAKYIRNFLGDGIKNGGTNLQITAPSDRSGMFVLMDEGYANIQGYFFLSEADYDGRYYQIDYQPAHPTLARIDRVVLRLDRTVAGRNILPFIKYGEAGTNRPPELTRGTNEWEISLAQIRIPPNALNILPEFITDERLDSSVCGIIDSLISADTQGLYDTFLKAYEGFMDSLNERYEDDYNNLITNQEQGFEDLLNRWKDLIGEAYTEIIVLQTFNFDNYFELPGTTLKIVRTEEEGSSSINENIVYTQSQKLLATRETRLGNPLVEKTTMYAADGETILKQVEATVKIKEDKMEPVEISIR